MERPTSDQIAAASAILRAHTRQHGATASETMLANTVYSILAVLGGPGQPAQQYAHDISIATAGGIKVKPMITENDDGSFTVTAENPMGLEVGETYLSAKGLELDDFGPDSDDDDEEPEDTPPEKTNLPNEATLDRMTKAQLLEAAKAEGITSVDEGHTNAQIVEEILAQREEE